MTKVIPNILKTLFPLLEKYLPAFAEKMAIDSFFRPKSISVRPEDKDFMAAAGKRVVNIRGTKVRYFEWGNHDKYVLLVHGWGWKSQPIQTNGSQIVKSRV